MNNKTLKNILWPLASLIWAFYAIGFTYFGLIGFILESRVNGFRRTLCGSIGCSNLEFILSTLWFLAILILIYVLPFIVIYFIRRKRRNTAS